MALSDQERAYRTLQATAMWGAEPVYSMRERNRETRIVKLRMLAMYLCRLHTNLSFPQIGKLFERHHTTVMHACREVERTAMWGNEKLQRASREIMDHVEDDEWWNHEEPLDGNWN